MIERIAKGTQKIKEENERSVSQYQIAMHRKISQLRQTKMNEIQDRSESLNKESAEEIS